MAEINSTTTNVSESRIEQTKCILGEIANIASTISQLMTDAIVAEDEQTREANVMACQSLSGTIGYLSDLAQEKIGGIKGRGDADKWILSPLYLHHKDLEADAVRRN